MVLASAAAAVGLAAPVRADIDNDQDFLKDLTDAGLTYKDGGNAITIGKAVCAMLDDGQSDAKIVTDLRNQNPDFQAPLRPSSPISRPRITARPTSPATTAARRRPRSPAVQPGRAAGQH